MDGVHDMGGLQGFGPVAPEHDEPRFHAEWERRCFALTVGCGFLGQWNIDQSRDARERMPAVDYLRTSYYEHWLFGLERLLVERDLLGEGEVDARISGDARAAQAVVGVPEAPGPEAMLSKLETRVSASCEAAAPPRFAVGDKVRARRLDATGHTRLPRYLRGLCGEIVRYQGSHILPDEHARSGKKVGAHLYAVAFDTSVLWTPERPGDEVVADLFEPYLEALDTGNDSP